MFSNCRRSRAADPREEANPKLGYNLLKDF
jgi:hypothetical protein